MSLCMLYLFFFKQKTAYEVRISDWSSDVCSSDLFTPPVAFVIVLVIVTHAGLDERERRLALPLMATVVALSMVAGASRLVPGIPAFFMPHKWTGVVVHDEARAALDQIGGTADRKSVA